MSAHNWVRDHCRRCGATRAWDWDAKRFTYNLGDGLGALSTRPACGKGKESRHSRRAGRRAKVLARSRAGSPRLLSREEKLRRLKAAEYQKNVFVDLSGFTPVPPSPEEIASAIPY